VLLDVVFLVDTDYQCTFCSVFVDCAVDCRERCGLSSMMDSDQVPFPPRTDYVSCWLLTNGLWLKLVNKQVRLNSTLHCRAVSPGTGGSAPRSKRHCVLLSKKDCASFHV